MSAYLETIESPAGPLRFAVNEEGALLGLRFLDGHYARTLEQELARAGFAVMPDRERTARARQELLEYNAGTRRTFTVPLVLTGSGWEIAVWRELTRIPFGETRSYGQVAARLGQPGAAQDVGVANARNRLPLVIPCHRVIGADGSLKGFAGGPRLKARLLAHEARVQAQAAA